MVFKLAAASHDHSQRFYMQKVLHGVLQPTAGQTVGEEKCYSLWWKIVKS